ncbi:DUF3786 domain-containing protein [Candidatus Electronema sp. PJ]|uniref:DUF3786 domain-containing protein n=1 Tax=Candidatus Electronema sp. PJ TaxID=3401572 RepID=UPI003AA93538
MNPYQFLRHTPGTNCGECGYPACLAFAAAVTKAGVRADLCPYLQRENLPAELLGGAVVDALEHRQDAQHTALAIHLRSKMHQLDLPNLASRLGAIWSAAAPDLLCFSYLAQPVRLGATNCFINEKQPADPRDEILLYNYVSLGSVGRGRKPDGTWVGMESLPNSLSKVRTLATYCEERLAEHFTGRAGRLVELGMTLGAVPANQSADVSLLIPVLPCVSLLLLFWDEVAEDRFTAKVKVLFDQHVLDFLDLESLVFAAERTADRLLELD